MTARSSRRAPLVCSVALVLAPAGAVAAAPAPASLDLARHTLRLDGDGRVAVTVAARCRAGLSAFELGAGVRQGPTFGAATVLDRDVVPCDGRRHTRTLHVPAESGGFAVGPADVELYLAAFDAVAGGDLLVTDTGRARVRR